MNWRFWKKADCTDELTTYPCLEAIPLEKMRESLEAILGGSVVISKSETEVDGHFINLTLTLQLTPPTFLIDKGAVE